MKLEIELDLNKIDYDAINKQIQDKIADLNIQETYDIKSKIDNRIEKLIDEDIVGTNSYIERNYWTSDSLTEKGKRFVEDMIKDKLTQIVNKTFTNEVEEAIKETIVEMIPDVLTSALFQRMSSAFYSFENTYDNKVRSMINNSIEQRLLRR